MNSPTQIRNWLDSVWPIGKNESLKVKQLVKLLVKFNYKITNTKEVYVQVDTTGDGYLTLSKVSSFLYRIQYRPMIRVIFDLVSENKSHNTTSIEKNQSIKTKIDRLSLYNFINEIQSQNISLDQVKNLIKNYHYKSIKLGWKCGNELEMDYELFEIYMNGSLNCISKYEQLDQSKPLSHYHISSSHNTYLENHQIVGKSSSDAYINVLTKGCKCVELDCWDDNKYKIPVISHGYTFTTKVAMSDVVRVIYKYAFYKSDNPVIVTLENHCSRAMEAKMAQYFTHIFGDSLLIPDKIVIKTLPTLDQLKRKIILRGKVDKKTHPDLAKLIYLKNIKSVRVDDNARMSVSYDEDVITLINTSQKDILKQYTKNNLVRVYPHGTRFNSSNYNPIKSWSDGCQLVALNWQYQKINMRLNEAFFRLNKECGYRLKPKYLTENQSEPKEMMNISIKILSGRYLLGSELSIKLLIIGYSQDMISKRSQKVKNNGLTPVWNQEFKFRLFRPYRDFLVFEIYDSKKLISYYAVKVDDIQTGYRNIPLNRIKENGLRGSLLCKVEI